MKQTILLPVFLSMAILLNAQQSNNSFLFSGSVIYEQILKFDIQLEGDAAQFAHALPKEQKSEKILHFSEEAALFQNHKSEEPEEAVPMEEGGMVITMYEPDNKTYMDLVNKELIEQQEFMTRIFLIESDMKDEKWKMTGKQRAILDYPCQEAVSEVEGKEVHAWFTPEIPVAVGPGRYCGLPGLVLALEMEDGDRTLTATDVELKLLDKGILKRPTKGKKVTREEFEDLVAEKMQEMGVEGEEGGGSMQTVVIKINE